MIKLLVFCFCSFICSNLFGQGLLKGKVVDDEKIALPNAYVTLCTTDSVLINSSVTNDDGFYQFKGVSAGEYLLNVSYVGCRAVWKQFTMPNRDMEMPAICLVSYAAMDEVSVNASSFIYKSDRIWIIPDKQDVKHAFNGYDLLYNSMIPGLDVNRQTGTVSLVSVGNVTLYIDGEKVDSREVKALRPRDVEKIEYSQTPTGKYAGEMCIINFITKKREWGGYVSLDGKQTVGYMSGDYNLVSKINHKQTDVTLLGGYSASRYHNRAEKEESFHFQEKDVFRNTYVNDACTKENGWYTQLNIKHRTPRNQLSLRAGLLQAENPQNYTDRDIVYNGTDRIKSMNQMDQRGIKPVLKLRGEFNLSSKEVLEVSFNETYTRNKYNRTYSEGEYDYSTKVKEDFHVLDFQGNYTIQLKDGSSAGATLSHYHQISSSDYSGDYTNWNHLWSGETFLIGHYSRMLGKKMMLDVQGGLDILSYKVHGNDRHSFVSPRYKVMMNYQINPKENLSFIFLRGNSHPPIDKVNRIEQRIDSINTLQGSANLKKENIYLANLAYSARIKKVTMQFVGFWNGAMPAFSDEYYVEDGQMIKGYCTDGEYHLIGFALDATYKVNKSLKFKVIGSYQNFRKTGKLKAHLGEWVASFDMNYYWKNFAFNLFVRSISRNITANPSFTRTPMSYGCSADWHNNNWTVEIGTQNPFTQRVKNLEYLSTDVYAYKTIGYNKMDQAMGYLKIAYVFDFGKKTSRDAEGVDRKIDSAIMKAK